ncbi:hypothetical protein KIF24_28690 [Micromonospora sp. Llam7]|uniref:hypothetical protein n=1 Tax=Micromonospora tarapacensis TaxID=2835305 RepID=UPI001C83C3E0|nr:hypothetical protein [Micromonospora tarapacensis]MBX7269597.1 hypothetical protein [Micromonospora tarapacensis]
MLDVITAEISVIFERLPLATAHAVMRYAPRRMQCRVEAYLIRHLADGGFVADDQGVDRVNRLPVAYRYQHDAQRQEGCAMTEGGYQYASRV